MRLFTMMITGLFFLGMTGLAMAKPSMLPQHPGYPSGGEFTNDAGKQNLSYSQSLLEAAKSGDTNMTAMFLDQDKARLTEQGVAGQLPVVQPPNVKTEPSVKDGERMTQ